MSHSKVTVSPFHPPSPLCTQIPTEVLVSSRELYTADYGGAAKKSQCSSYTEIWRGALERQTKDKKKETKTHCRCGGVCVWGGGLAPSVRYCQKNRCWKQKWIKEEIEEMFVVDFLWHGGGGYRSISGGSCLKQTMGQRSSRKEEIHRMSSCLWLT